MKNKIILVFIALLGLSWFSLISSMVSKPGDYREHIEKAEDLEERGIYIDAISEYEEALAYVPEDIDIMLKMANDYLMINDSKKYVSTLQKVIEAEQEGSEEALNTLMNYYIDDGKEYKAAQYIKNYTDKSPDVDYANKWLIKLEGSYRELYCRYEEMFGMYNDTMIVKNSDGYSAVDSSGNRILDNTFKQLSVYSIDGFAQTVNEKGNTIYIDKDGLTRVVPDGKYRSLGILNDSRIAASENNKYGYLDENGEPVTEFVWTDLTAFNKAGMAEKDGKWAIIGSKGKEKTDYIYDDVIVDPYGIACNQERIFVKIGDKYQLINTKGKAISKTEFDGAKAFNADGYAAVCQKDKWGFVDPDGELIIKCQYDDARTFSNGYAAVCQNGLWGYIDEAGNLIIKPQFIKATDFSSVGTAAVKVKGEEDQPDEWHVIKLNMES